MAARDAHPSPDPHPSPGRWRRSREIKPPNLDGGPSMANTNTNTNAADDEHSDETDDDEWGSDSLYEELLSEDTEYDPEPGSDVCTPQERQQYISLLRRVGIDHFVSQTVGAGKISAKKLCSAFAVTPPVFLHGQPDHVYYRLLGLAISRELQKRCRLERFTSFDDAVELLKVSQNIMVITGAGISTSLGIPDFRSKTSGFYSRLRERSIEDPQEVFDLENFDDDPTIFYSLSKDILPDTKVFSPTHQFIRLLQDKGKLLRNYSQNIDNIEANAGISKEKLVQCHGSWANATCRKCNFKVPGSDLFPSIRAHKVYRCPRCEITVQMPRPDMKRKWSGDALVAKKRKRSYFPDCSDDDDDGQYDIPEAGVMKPDITFFGEKLPNNFGMFADRDRHHVDLIIVIGTSMKVAPVSEMPNYVDASIPQIYISRDPIFHMNFDINLLGLSDLVVTELCRRAGWDLQHEMIPRGQVIDVETSEKEKWTHTIRARE